MAQLGIKIDESVKQAFIDLGIELDLTQPELIARLLQVHEQLGVPVNNDAALTDLQNTISSQNLAISKNESKITKLANDNEALNDLLKQQELAESKIKSKIASLANENVALQAKIQEQQVLIEEKDNKISSLANDNKALQDILAISEKKVQELSQNDLTADIKELSLLTKLSKAVHLYVQQRARVALRSAKNITEEQAVKLFIESYND